MANAMNSNAILEMMSKYCPYPGSCEATSPPMPARWAAQCRPTRTATEMIAIAMRDQGRILRLAFRRKPSARRTLSRTMAAIAPLRASRGPS
ncbi:hypothetical protein BMS3Bbin01_02403 [bacterium BMS3Bbin01]|nr:hypothetical protein BMS3Bbin01_02403 [bacterium BMS3Bbin01]